MVSLLRTLRSIRRVGLREWWRQMQYIGDAKSGVYVGKDQYAKNFLCQSRTFKLDGDSGSAIAISRI